MRQCVIWTAHSQRHGLLRMHYDVVRECDVAKLRVLVRWLGVVGPRRFPIDDCALHVPNFVRCW
jgi:hypothetical protein